MSTISPLIMVAVSEDPACRTVLGFAAAITEATAGLLIPVHVRPTTRALGAHEYVVPMLEACQSAALRAASRLVCEVAGPMTALRMLTVRGPASKALARAARDLRADLVVVGRDRSRRLAGGRRAAKAVVRDCPVPVVVIPTGAPGGRGAVEGPWPDLDRELARLIGRPEPPRRPEL